MAIRKIRTAKGTKGKTYYQVTASYKGKRFKRRASSFAKAVELEKKIKEGKLKPLGTNKTKRGGIPAVLFRPYLKEWLGERSVYSVDFPEGFANNTARKIWQGEGEIGLLAADNFLSAVGRPDAWHADEELSRYY